MVTKEQVLLDEGELRAYATNSFDAWLDMTGLTQGEYENILEKQAGRCFYCNKLLNGTTNLILAVCGPVKLGQVLLCPDCMDQLEKVKI